MFLNRFKCRVLKCKNFLSFSNVPVKTGEIETEKMASWQIHAYGGLDELIPFVVRPPVIRHPDEVVVKVQASSVNPLDLLMISGYGSTMLNLLRQAERFSLSSDIEFPIILGRDFAGTIMDVGHRATTEFRKGDQVWGVIPPHQQGAFAQRVVVNKNFVAEKPTNLSMIEAGSMLYAALTAWSALKITGDLAIFPAYGQNVLVIGASGGVGCMAVQMLRAWGANVVAICSTSAIPLVQSLGVPVIIDYTSADADSLIAKNGKYDIVLDCAGLGENGVQKYAEHLKEFRLSKVITLSSPLMKNCDSLGLVAGMLKNASDLLISNFNSGLLTRGTTLRWGFFFPTKTAIDDITALASQNKLLPCIDSTYSFTKLPEAFNRAQAGHLRGKIAIDFSG